MGLALSRAVDVVVVVVSAGDLLGDATASERPLERVPRPVVRGRVLPHRGLAPFQSHNRPYFALARDL